MQARALGKATELGIVIIAITIMVLAGCGGGSGGTSISATCSAAGNVTGAAAANCFISETHASWRADLAGMINSAGSNVIATAGTSSFVAVGANSYTVKSTYMELATVSSVWSTPTPPPTSSYLLTATGWQPYDSAFAAFTYTNNGDGTITAVNTLLQGQYELSAITRTDLTGQPVACTNPLGSDFVGENIGSASSPVIVTAASCPVAVTYPAGSVSYTAASKITMGALYPIWDNPAFTLTDGAGVSLSALPGIGTQFCANGFVYDPIAGAAAGADNYNVHFAPPYSCTAANINNALNSLKLYTALISWKATGNAVVPSVFDIKVTSAPGTYEFIYAFHLGKLMYGLYTPAFTLTSTSTGVNNIAANAQLQASGLPLQ